MSSLKIVMKTSALVLSFIVLLTSVGCRSHKRIPVTFREVSPMDALDSKNLIIGIFYQKSPNFQTASDLVRLLERRFARDDVFNSVHTENEFLDMPEEFENLESVMDHMTETDWVEKYSETDADLLLVGSVAYFTRDRSGYDSEWLEDRRGYRIPHKVYKNRIGFDLELVLMIVDLRSGETVFTSIYDDTGQVEGAADEVSIYFDLINEQVDEFMNELLGEEQRTYRYLIYR
jgi:hypothetical protein